MAGSTTYRIRVRGRLAPSWSSRLAGMIITTNEPSGETITTLTGELVDQSALQGIINALVDLHVEVLSVQQLEPKISSTG